MIQSSYHNPGAYQARRIGRTAAARGNAYHWALAMKLLRRAISIQTTLEAAQ
ncbi:hypothetical protein SP695_004655 [Salmonella enterica]|nr:hypothetical protein [Salmonella enterica]